LNSQGGIVLKKRGWGVTGICGRVKRRQKKKGGINEATFFGKEIGINTKSCKPNAVWEGGTGNIWEEEKNRMRTLNYR